MRKEFDGSKAVIVNLPDSPEKLQLLLANAQAKAIRHIISTLPTEEEQRLAEKDFLDYIQKLGGHT